MTLVVVGTWANFHVNKDGGDPPWLLLRAVRILLECIFVCQIFINSFSHNKNILPSAVVESSVKSFTISFMFDDDNEEPLETLASSTAEFQLLANNVIRQVIDFEAA